MEIAVYLFTGFLEAGKTQFLQETFENEDFNTDENTLILMCEEGIEELDPSVFAVNNVFIEYIEAPEELTRQKLEALQKKHDIRRVVIEYNGMWQLDTLYRSLPDTWSVYQEIFVADSNTFIAQNKNMRSLVVDKLQSCELAVFNRASVMTDREEIHKIVRGISTRASIDYEFEDGHVEQDDIEDPLPFDLDAPIVEISEDDYAVWYRDMTEDTEKYLGKTLKFKCIAGRDSSLADNEFLAGRHVMTCCADDIAFLGLIAKSDKAVAIKNRTWIMLTAVLSFGYHKVYKGSGPILKVTDIALTSKPEQEVASFY